MKNGQHWHSILQSITIIYRMMTKKILVFWIMIFVSSTTMTKRIDLLDRCTLIQKVNDHCEDLNYGLWVSLSEKSYFDYESNFKKEVEEKTYFGWLCNEITEYDFSESIPMNVVTSLNGLRPELFPHKDFDHPFVTDFYNGISKNRS